MNCIAAKLRDSLMSRPRYCGGLGFFALTSVRPRRNTTHSLAPGWSTYIIGSAFVWKFFAILDLIQLRFQHFDLTCRRPILSLPKPLAIQTQTSLLVRSSRFLARRKSARSRSQRLSRLPVPKGCAPHVAPLGLPCSTLVT